MTTRKENRGPRDAKEEIKALFKAYKTNSDYGREKITDYLLKNPDAIDALWWLASHIDPKLVPYGIGLKWNIPVYDELGHDRPMTIEPCAPPRGKEWVEAYSFSEGSKIIGDMERKWVKNYPKALTHFLPVY